MIISAVMPIMSIYRVPCGQCGYSGDIINLAQDVASFANSLPRLPSQLDVIVVKKEGTNQSYRDFHVRRGIVHQPLQWLVIDNKYYRALCISIDVNTLAQLPQDGNHTHLTSITVDHPNSSFSADCPTCDISSANSPTSDSTDSYDSHFTQSFVPIATR